MCLCNIWVEKVLVQMILMIKKHFTQSLWYVYMYLVTFDAILYIIVNQNLGNVLQRMLKCEVFTW